MTPFAPAVEKWHAFVVACINAIGEVSKQEAVDAIEGYGAELGLLEAGATDPAVATSSDQPQAVVAHHALSPSSVAPERGEPQKEKCHDVLEMSSADRADGPNGADDPRANSRQLCGQSAETATTTDGGDSTRRELAPERGGALRERLAALAHEQWAGWMRYLFSRCEGPMPTWESDGLLMPIEWVKRWERQMNTPYADLSEAEKDSDRKEADRVLAALAFPEPLSERQNEKTLVSGAEIHEAEPKNEQRPTTGNPAERERL